MHAVTQLHEARDYLKRRPETRFVDVLLADNGGVLRGKRITAAELGGVYSKGLYLPGSMFALDVLGHTIEATGLGFDDGDADRACLPLPDTLLAVPWLGPAVAQVQVAMHEIDGTPFFGDPYHVLGGVLDKFRALGLKPVIAIELEFYFVDRERASGMPQPPVSPRTGRREFRTQINSMEDLDDYSAILTDIAAQCAIQEIPTGTALAEYGPGQFEVNLQHVDDAQRACDHAIRLKRLVKGVAHKHGMEATFMAKPYREMAGSGTHIHVSVLDAAGRNVFASDDELGSPRMRNACAGMLATMADGMAVFAPNANSYRRLRPEAYVPMTPNWGLNNRGVAVRVPVSDPSNRRLEHRVAGADANPYLLAAWVLAGIHHGLVERMQPPAPWLGNAYKGNDGETLPAHWANAFDRFERSALAQEYFGERFVKLYATTRRGELEAFASHVSPLEIEWYLRGL
ncbi:MAG TPA: glutamine synthetase family protein [Steroidobacteraceae bacterium]|nr:glutamine synthetase family protein [Steroidobacteraceae bacterium]